MAVAICPLCEAACGLVVDVDNDQIRGIRGDTADPMSRGYICPKASLLADLHRDPLGAMLAAAQNRRGAWIRSVLLVERARNHLYLAFAWAAA
jgi:hypothetical protein